MYKEFYYYSLQILYVCLILLVIALFRRVQLATTKGDVVIRSQVIKKIVIIFSLLLKILSQQWLFCIIFLAIYYIIRHYCVYYNIFIVDRVRKNIINNRNESIYSDNRFLLSFLCEKVNFALRKRQDLLLSYCSIDSLHSSLLLGKYIYTYIHM